MLNPDNLTPKILPKDKESFSFGGQSEPIRKNMPNVRKDFKEIYEEGKGGSFFDGEAAVQKKHPSNIAKNQEKEGTPPANSLFDLSAERNLKRTKEADRTIFPQEHSDLSAISPEMPLLDESIAESPSIEKHPPSQLSYMSKQFSKEMIRAAPLDETAEEILKLSPKDSKQIIEMPRRPGAKSNIGKPPEPVTGNPPESVTMMHPEPVIGQSPKPVIGKPPESAAGMHPEPVAGKPPTPVAGIHAEPVTGKPPESAAGMNPEPIIGKQPLKEERIENLEKPKGNEGIYAGQIDTKPAASSKEQPKTDSLPRSDQPPHLFSGTSSVEALSSEGIKKPRENMRIPSPIREIVEQLVNKIYTLKTPGQLETVVVLNKPGLFKDVSITVTSYESARSEFNLTFSNLTQAAKNLLDMKLNQDSLKLALDQKGIMVHIITTTTLSETRPIITAPQGESQGRFAGGEEGQDEPDREGEDRKRQS